MPDILIEPCIITALAWRRKALLIAEKSISPGCDELPSQEADDFVQHQIALAENALEKVKIHVEELLLQAGDRGKIALHNRERLLEDLESGKRSPSEINHTAAELLKTAERCEKAIAQCKRWLRLLQEEEEAPLPVLPLQQYAKTFEQLFQTTEPEEYYVNTNTNAPALETNSTGTGAEGTVFRRICRIVWEKTDRLDKIALGTALVLCMVVFLFGYSYLFWGGAVELQTLPIDENRFKVTCTNRTRNAIILHVPYDGGDLSDGRMENYGIQLERIVRGKANVEPVHGAALWHYKNQPVRLYGPLIVEPFTAIEIFLDGSSLDLQKEEGLRITLIQGLHQARQSQMLVYGGDITQQK